MTSATQSPTRRNHWLPGALLALSLIVPAAAAEASAQLVVGGPLDFGTTTVGSPKDRSAFVQNVGDEATYMSVHAPNGYVVTHYPANLFGPGAAGTIGIRLLASQPGTYIGTVTVLYSGGATYFSVSGTVVCPTSPSVTLTAPANGSTQSPNAAGNVILSASASDPGGVDKVEFWVDGARVVTDFAENWAYAWPARGGPHTAFARAFNNCGASTTSSTNSFTVDCGKPTVTWTGPANGSTVSPNLAGNVILSATASHSTGIAKVEFWVDGALQMTRYSSPYVWAWPASSGSHSAYALAYSNCPSVKKTSTVTFTVN